MRITILISLVILSVQAQNSILNQLISSFQESESGSQLWFKWVTKGQKLSLWDNTQQMREQEKDKTLEDKDIKGLAFETRWDINALISNKPENEQLLLMELGQEAFCAPYCYTVLFGVSTYDEKNVQLVSYDTKNLKVKDAVKKLHQNHDLQDVLIDYKDLTKKNVSIKYVFRKSEKDGVDEFYGEGIAHQDDGSYIDIKETIRSGSVAPLENFYDQNGNCPQKSDVPVIYKPVQQKQFRSQ